MKPMKWRIIQKKLLFIRKVMHEKKSTSLVRRVIMEEIITGIKGLGVECRNACEELEIPNVVIFDLPPWQIKTRINEIIKEEAKEAMLNSSKVADRVTDNPEDNRYIEKMTLANCRIWIRYRARSIKGVKINLKGSYKDNLRCRLCTANVHESQEHLEMCEGTANERRGLGGLEVGNWRDKLVFWICDSETGCDCEKCCCGPGQGPSR